MYDTYTDLALWPPHCKEVGHEMPLTDEDYRHSLVMGPPVG